ncbi:MAG: glycosyltransferase family 39 protein [Bacteroidales bacterium]
MLTYLPKYFTSIAIALYFILLVGCSVVFMHPLPIIWIFLGIIEVVCFFYFTNILSKNWSDISNKLFTKKLIQTALLIRIIYVVIIYFFYLYMTGQPFEFDAADSMGYHEEAILRLSALNNGDYFNALTPMLKNGWSDTGYPVYLTIMYKIFGVNILLLRIIKAIISAYTCLLIYKLAKRNFGEPAGRLAGIISMLFPNLIYYCGLHVKETEMVFLTVLVIERFDYFMRTNKLNSINILYVLIIMFLLFTLRTVLAVTIFLAFISYIFLSGQKTNNLSRVLFVTGTIIYSYFFIGGNIEKEISFLWKDKDSNQITSMQWRTDAKGGNKLAKYGSAKIFAPAMISAPFPTLVNVDGQDNQMLLNGGYFTKNIFSFFVYISLIVIWQLKKIKQNILILSFLFGYLAVLALSGFAISERFHLPAVPFLIILAAYGITQTNQKNKRYYIPFLALMALLIIGWNWFKLAGRGMY